MSHVEHHVVFECFLVLLHEFDKETEGKDISQTESEEESAMQFLAVILIKIDHDEEQDQISYRFIELSRMTGKHIYPFEYECPGYIGRVTDNFGVHQIRQTDEAGGDRSSDGNHVHHIHIMKFRLAAIQPKGDHQSECTSVTGINSVGRKLYFSVLAVFLVFAVSFIVFQQAREKQYKIGTLTIKLENYNELLAEDLALSPGEGIILQDSLHNKNVTVAHEKLQAFVREHESKDLRVTLVRPNGKVIYDNMSSDYEHFANHAKREEIAEALKNRVGSSVERQSKTLKHDYFYVASYFPESKLIIRTALPYNNDLAKSLQADQHFIWFAIVAVILLTIVLYRFTDRLAKNVSKLSIFAYKADHNESLEVEDLAKFPNDELGEIAERIIKMYKRIQTTRREQDVLKRQLTQNIAHELKTPVASIQGYLETILDNPHINEEMKSQFLQRCYAQSERLTSLLRDISTLNRLDDGSDMIDFEAVDITQMVREIARETALERESHKMTFENLLPDQHIIVKGNRSLLYSVFRNLTDNAIAYAGEGRKITLSAKEQGNKWHFIFCDNGQGVPAEHLSRLFERFYRVDKGRSRKMGGTGLGLAIVKNAVLLHGGTIRVSNQLEGGLKFEFTLKK